MNVNSLDARAFSARGGLGDGLADVIRAIAGGYLQNQDNADARLDRQATLSAELRRRNEDIGRQDRMRAEDQQRQDARYAVTDAYRAWQRSHTESQDSAAQAERDRVAGRQGLADALEQASKYGVVPQRPDFVTAPTEREQAVWGAANRGAEDRSLSAELKRSQAREAEARALAAMTKTGKVTNSYDRTKFKQVRVTKEDENGDTVTTTELVPIEANPSPVEPELDAGVSGGISEALNRYYNGGWFGSGKGDAEPLRKLDPSALAQVAKKQGLAVPSLDRAAAPVAPAAPSAPFRPAWGGGYQDALAQASDPLLQSPARPAPVQPMGAQPAPAPNPRAAALQTIDQERDALAGMGIDHRLLLSPDLNQRRAVLARMPIDARRRTIDALRIIDSTATR